MLQEQETPSNFFSYKETGKITTDELRTRTKFQRFLNKTPRSPFKKLTVSTPGLLQGLHMMSLAKSVPKGLDPQECERTMLREPLPVPYILEKDKVQEKVAKLQNLQIKTLLEMDTTLNFPVWHKNGTREAFLMHVTAVLDAMKKHGHFNNYDRVQKAYEEAMKAAKSAEAGLALLKGTSAGTTSKRKKKALAKAKEAAKEALAKAHGTKPEAKEAVEAPNVTEDLMKDGFQADLEKARQARETAQGTMTAATNLMFTFYLNLPSPKSKYAWNKIIIKQTESNPFVNLQGVSLEGPRGMLRNLFNDCVMFRAAQYLHLPDAVLLLQPQRKRQHQAQEHPVHVG